MTYSILIILYRKPSTSPKEFKDHYEGKHMPLIRELAGETFPLSHRRRYVYRSSEASAAAGGTDRNPTTPATVLMGSPADVDFDALSEVNFTDEPSFQAFFGFLSQPENAAKLAAGEEMFLDREKTSIVVLGEVEITTKD
ncbi:EthD domain-containing protein [Xylariomycetidae sp. FL2044]|nr:EthD domain-containing protein [Xylariomycetidae sp. FL2044]